MSCNRLSVFTKFAAIYLAASMVPRFREISSTFDNLRFCANIPSFGFYSGFFTLLLSLFFFCGTGGLTKPRPYRSYSTVESEKSILADLGFKVGFDPLIKWPFMAMPLIRRLRFGGNG